MEYCAKGDLFSIIGEGNYYRMGFVKKLFLQLLEGISYLHKKKIAHLDIKPENILLTENLDIKLADFGCCQCVDLTTKPKICGTLFYVSPEILRLKCSDGRTSDIWSFGIVLFSIITGRLPWTGTTDKAIAKQILSADLSFPAIMPTDVTKIIKKCTSLNSEQRPTANELLTAGWFSGRHIISKSLPAQTQSLSYNKVGSKETRRSEKKLAEIVKPKIKSNITSPPKFLQEQIFAFQRPFIFA